MSRCTVKLSDKERELIIDNWDKVRQCLDGFDIEDYTVNLYDRRWFKFFSLKTVKTYDHKAMWEHINEVSSYLRINTGYGSPHLQLTDAGYALEYLAGTCRYSNFVELTYNNHIQTLCNLLEFRMIPSEYLLGNDEIR